MPAVQHAIRDLEATHGLWNILRPSLGPARARRLLASVALPQEVVLPPGPTVRRVEVAMAMNLVLFGDLMERVPHGRAYVGDVVRSGRRVVFDHGAVRTVAAACGELPAGRIAFSRILEPLGYFRNGEYPLERLGMTGWSYTHQDLPEEIAQFFVSELHPERFSAGFQEAVQRVVGSTVDPLSPRAKAQLQELALHRELPVDAAAQLVPELVACFDRLHDDPALADYEVLLAESAEMAWIATEGHAFNHATDRVDDVAAVADGQRALGRPVKEALEVSRNRRVVQTAFRAADVERCFVGDDGHLVVRSVPGSFHEFITRHRDDDGALDLSFDAANAQGIFAMTSRKTGSRDAGER